MARGNRPRKKRRINWKKGAAIATTGAVLGAAGFGLHSAVRPSKETRRAMNARQQMAERALDADQYHTAEYYHLLSKRPLMKHEETLTRPEVRELLSGMAGTNFNLTTVLDTATRWQMPPRAEYKKLSRETVNEMNARSFRDWLSREMSEQRNALRGREVDMSTPAGRKIELLKRLGRLSQGRESETHKMLSDLSNVRSRDVERVRHELHGAGENNWRYAAPGLK